MLRAMAAAGALFLGMMHSSATAMEPMPASDTCPARCRNMPHARPSMQDSMDAGMARIAARAAQPQSEQAALSRQERVELYLLLSLHGHAGRGKQ